jgi:arginase
MTDFGGALKSPDEFPDYRLAVLGVPFDEKSSYLRGSAAGPRAVREASTGKCYNPETELGVDLYRDTVLADLGDVDTSGDVDKTFALIEKGVAAILSKKAVPIVLGGDHSITYPVIKAFARSGAPLDILHFDAHPDLYEDLYGDRLSHACPMARILEDGLCRNLVQVGIRSATEDHRALAARHGVRMIEMKDIQEPPALKFENPLYVSFDLDALDPAFAPGISHREPGGLSTRQALAIIQSLDARIVGFDIVELNPSRDPAGVTAAVAFKIMQEIAGKIVRP